MKLNLEAIYTLTSGTNITKTHKGALVSNNFNSLIFQGEGVYNWLSRLLSILDGKTPLDTILCDLTETKKVMIFNIFQELLKRNLIKEITKYKTHNLNPELIEKFRNQINFIDGLTDNAEYRFELFRKSRVLIIGYGPFLNALLHNFSLNGLEKVQVKILDQGARKIDLNYTKEIIAKCSIQVDLSIYNNIPLMIESIKNILTDIDYIIYADESFKPGFVYSLNKLISQTSITMFAISFYCDFGIIFPVFLQGKSAGPLAAWYTFKHKTFKHIDKFNKLIPMAILSNMCVYEMFKISTNCLSSELLNCAYLLNIAACEGKFHNFIPNPLYFPISDDNSAPSKQSNNATLETSLSMLNNEYFGLIRILNNQVQTPLTHYIIEVSNILSKKPSDNDMRIINIFHIDNYKALKETILAGCETYLEGLIKPLQKVRALSKGSFSSKIYKNLLKLLDGKNSCFNYTDILKDINGKINYYNFKNLLLEDKLFVKFAVDINKDTLIERAINNLISDIFLNQKCYQFLKFKELDLKEFSEREIIILNDCITNIYQSNLRIFITSFLNMSLCVISTIYGEWFSSDCSLLEAIKINLIKFIAFLQDNKNDTKHTHLLHNMFIENNNNPVISNEIATHKQNPKPTTNKLTSDEAGKFNKILFMSLKDQIPFKIAGLHCGLIIAKMK